MVKYAPKEVTRLWHTTRVNPGAYPVLYPIMKKKNCVSGISSFCNDSVNIKTG